MRAIRCHTNQGPKALRFEKTEVPQPPKGWVRIRVGAAGVNFADSLLSWERYQEKPARPFTLGLELAGWIDLVGQGVSGFEVGQRVLALVDFGAFAEFAIAKESDVIALPESMSVETAAGFAITYGTAIAALDWRASLKVGERLLVHGAGGGVGAAAVACGRAMGADVTATARGEKKLGVARAHGANRAIEVEQADLTKALKQLVPTRFDVVFDPVGGATFQSSMQCIAWEGRIVIIGFASGDVPQIPANHVLVKNITISGLYWGSYRKQAPARLQQGFSQLFDWHEQGLLGEIVPEIVTFDEGISAIADIASRRTVGKTVISLIS